MLGQWENLWKEVASKYEENIIWPKEIDIPMDIAVTLILAGTGHMWLAIGYAFHIFGAQLLIKTYQKLNKEFAE